MKIFKTYIIKQELTIFELFCSHQLFFTRPVPKQNPCSRHLMALMFFRVAHSAFSVVVMHSQLYHSHFVTQNVLYVLYVMLVESYKFYCIGCSFDELYVMQQMLYLMHQRLYLMISQLVAGSYRDTCIVSLHHLEQLICYGTCINRRPFTNLYKKKYIFKIINKILKRIFAIDSCNVNTCTLVLKR